MKSLHLSQDTVMNEGSHESERVKQQIGYLSTRLSLPTIARVFSSLEGEHPSPYRGNGYDFLDLAQYQPGDEARLIDWKTSAKLGEPIIVHKQHTVHSTVWMLLDTGPYMWTSTPSAEYLIEVVANSLRMVAALSLKRSDAISLVTSDDNTLTRTPFSGKLPAFSHLLDRVLSASQSQYQQRLKDADTTASARTNFENLINYAEKIEEKNSLLIIAVSDYSLHHQYLDKIKRLSRTHPIIFVSATSINPLLPGDYAVVDTENARSIPSFLRSDTAAQQLDARKDFLTSSFHQLLNKNGGILVKADSSTHMLKQFTHLIAQVNHSFHSQLPNSSSHLSLLRHQSLNQ